ncbi:3821_t:CDS:2 [Rhizophagus irregularis]|nr:3821_t:CDS:2 [Rhizophagus irregularis]
MLKRLRRREVPVDVHSEDEEEFDATRGVLEFSDISDSEASEDSDVESEATHSEGEGEEEIQEETSVVKEEATITREELSLTKEKESNSTHKDTSSLVEDTSTASIEDISKGVEQPKSTEHKLKAEDQLEIKQEENNSTIAIKDSGEDGISSTDGDELQSHSGNEIEVRDEKRDDSKNSVNVPEMSGWQKKVLARQEYRKKLAEDPAFVPHLGEFWGHDDRFIKDELRDDFDSHYRKSPFASSHNSLPYYIIYHYSIFTEKAPRRRSHFHNNITTPKFNHSRPSNSIIKRRNSFEEQSRSRGMFLSKYDTNHRRGNGSSSNFKHHKSSVRGSRSENSYNGNDGNVSSTSRFNDNKSYTGKDNSFPPKGGNGFRGRGYSSRHYMRSGLNRDHSFNSNQADVSEVDGKHNLSQDKNSKEQRSNNDSVDNKDSHIIHNNGQQESRENKIEENINIVAEYKIEKAEPAQESTDITSHVNITSSSFTKEGTDSGSPIKEKENVYEKLEEESGVEIILDSQSKKAIEDNVTPISQSINNVTSSFNELSINNNQSDTIVSLPSTLMDKDKVQTNQASKRYSTRRAASFSITQPTQTNDSPASGISNNSRTSEIPPSAVFAPPFQPRALALSDEISISNEDSSNTSNTSNTSNNFFPQKPETPIAYYMDNLPQGLRNNLSENNLPPLTSIPPASYVAEKLKDTNDNSVKSSSFVSQSSTGVQENDGVYYYYPVYYQ